MEDQTTTSNFQRNVNPLLSELPFTISKTTRDMKFMGTFYIVYGIISCLSIFGAIIGVPMLISGLRLREAADEFNAYRDTNLLDRLYRGFERQGKFFSIQKIIVIVSIILAIFFIVVMIMVIAAGLLPLMNNSYQSYDEF